MSATAGPFAEVVIGALDVELITGFLALFGLEEFEQYAVGEGEAAGIYGLDHVPGPARRLHAPLAGSAATILVVPTPHLGSPARDWQHGPRALDLYTTDLDRSVAIARSAGYSVSPEAVLAGGPMRLRQALVRGPEQLPIVLVDSTHRRASICDLPASPSRPTPLHSEPHSVVWCVADPAAETTRWVSAGWTAGAGISFSEPSVSDELGLPERPTPISMTMLSDADVRPIRLELLGFDDHPGGGTARAIAGPLVSGLAALVAEVPSIALAADSWGGGATFGPVVDRRGDRAVRATTAGGVSLLLVERG